MSLETTFPIPEGFGFLRAHGQGRVVGFLIQKPLEPPRAVVIHLDYPGVIMESEVSPTYITGATAAVSNLPLIPLASLNKMRFLVLSVEYLHPDGKSSGRLQHPIHFSLQNSQLFHLIPWCSPLERDADVVLARFGPDRQPYLDPSILHD